MLLGGLGLAFLSAVASQIGFLLRERGARNAPDVDIRRPLRSAIDLFRSKWWTIGYGVAFIAYLFHVGALSLAALSMVQAVLAGGLVILAVLAERFFGFKLGRRQWAGVIIASAGLAFLALTGDSNSGQHSSDYSVPAMIAFEATLVGIGTALLLSCRTDRARDQRGVLLAATAGLIFTVTHVAIKASTGKLDAGIVNLVLNPFLLIALAGMVVGFFASARSLQIGPAVPVIAVTSIAGNVSSIPAGIVVFGDPLGSDTLAVTLRTLAFLLVIAAAALMPVPHRAAEEQREAGEDERTPAQGRPEVAPA
jgi:drug/metabolite transporter (DMT)-like permease